MKSLALLEPFIVLFDALLAATWVAMACVIVVHAMPPELIAESTPVPASFDVATPAPQAEDAVPRIVAARN